MLSPLLLFASNTCLLLFIIFLGAHRSHHECVLLFIPTCTCFFSRASLFFITFLWDCFFPPVFLCSFTTLNLNNYCTCAHLVIHRFFCHSLTTFWPPFLHSLAFFLLSTALLPPLGQTRTLHYEQFTVVLSHGQTSITYIHDCVPCFCLDDILLVHLLAISHMHS